MKTLLIDNYDSYTYNLFQLIAEVNGEEPVVVLNDAPPGPELDLRGFDNIVVSPGPGHPAEPRDFGIGTTLLARSGIPVLGVCLGHQGIAVGERARVAAAPRPRHGHLSRIRHDGRELFQGLPQNFTAVRYHSLSVQSPLPRTLEATAWAEDGVLMGLRHRSRPMWGVQFHPESVLTEFGHRMLTNFRDLTAARRRPRSRTRPAAPAPNAPPRVPVPAPCPRPAATGCTPGCWTPPWTPRRPSPGCTVTRPAPSGWTAPGSRPGSPASPSSATTRARCPSSYATTSVPAPARSSGPGGRCGGSGAAASSTT